MENIERYSIFNKLIETMDTGIDYITTYDGQLHDYNGTILYQAEAKVINAVGNNPGITISELATQAEKSTSAYSQLIRKLRAKGWVKQERNDNNNREYNLFLTDDGKKIFEGHQKFEEYCYRRTYHMLDDFSEQDMENYIRIQEKLNDSFKMDVEDSKKVISREIEK
jgi:DNA-binding MarR family transcriptional regulator